MYCHSLSKNHLQIMFMRHHYHFHLNPFINYITNLANLNKELTIFVTVISIVVTNSMDL